ncbi:MAG: hypothetical protein COA83_03835 [Methylophaga sp.]|nr:MAG: hypothetical protein COA83_03835 [Methylophaga sp.]
MNTIPVFQAGLAGLQTAMQSMQQNASKIANPETLQSAGGFTEPLVKMLRDEQQVEASVKVIQTSNSMIGSIIDITA